MTEIFNLSLKDFLVVIKKSWISILIFAIIGFIGTFIYLQFLPNVYLATAQFQLAQIRMSNYEWSNLEDPNLLIARMKSPTGLGDKSLAICQYSSPSEIVKNIQFGPVKASPPTIEVILKNQSPELSLKCMEAIIDDIKNYQADLVSKKILQYQGMLEYYSGRLSELKKDYPHSSKSEGAIALVDAISAKAQIQWITDRVLSLDSFIRFADEGAGRLLSPVYVSTEPAFPKRSIIMIAGLLLGLLSGLFVGIFRHAYLPRLKAL